MKRAFDFTIAIGGAAGQGSGASGDVLAKIVGRRGLHLYAYNAYQSIIRGGHILLTVRVSDQPLFSHGDKLDVLIALNQDTMDRHLKLMGPGSKVIYNDETVKPGQSAEGVELCPMPIARLTNDTRNKLVQNTVALGVTMSLLGLPFDVLGEILQKQFQKKGQAVVDENVGVARAGYDHARANFKAFPVTVPKNPTPLGTMSGNHALAMGGAAAGVKFYCAYPMSPATGILVWFAARAHELGVMVRQMEDEIAVINMAIGAAHAGCRAMCATSGGGFALMTEALGMAGMMEVPVVIVLVQRAGPSTGVPTKTEQGDLRYALGAAPGDFPHFIVAPTSAVDAFHTVPELFNLCEKYQCPGIVLSDLLISEGTYSVDPALLNFKPKIDRGELITTSSKTNGYLRYKDTANGVSPRAIPGLEGYVHVVSTDEHDEDGILISDEFTNPLKRQRMVEKRSRKFKDIEKAIAAPALEGPADAEITLVGWGSTYGVIKEAIEQLESKGVTANHLSIKWIVPFHAEAVQRILSKSKKTVIVENNFSGQFYHYLRGETGITADGHIRKYDGEPFMPHHIVNGVMEHVRKKVDVYVPVHEITV